MQCLPNQRSWRRHVAVVAMIALVWLPAGAATTNVVTVSLTPAPANVFSPYDALGAGVDVLYGQDPTVIYSPTNLTQMLAAGFGGSDRQGGQ